MRKTIENVAASRAKTTTKETQAHILVVDDNGPNLLVAQMMLEIKGYRVTTATSGPMAIDFYRRTNFDMVIMDLQMPDMNGWEATQLIHEIEFSKSEPRYVPIFALTAHAVDSFRDRCAKVGMDGYITKPINKEEFLNAVSQAITLA